MKHTSEDTFHTGLLHGIPIALGYLAVSFSIGLSAVLKGLSPAGTVLLSATNLTSAGQAAGLLIMAAGGTLWETVLSQLVINLRYALMSISLSQKLENSMPLWKRMLIAFGVTDEIYAVAIARPHAVRLPYFLGLLLLPFLGWSAGTMLGVCAGNILPTLLTNALGLALYGMFLAIVIPGARSSRAVAFVCAFAIGFSVMFAYVPFLSSVTPGLSIIICAVAASLLGAWLFPHKEVQS